MTFTKDELDTIAGAVADRIRPMLEQATVKPLMRPKEAATYLCRSVGNLRRLLATGEIPTSVVRRIGRSLYFDSKELSRWLAAQ